MKKKRILIIFSILFFLSLTTYWTYYYFYIYKNNALENIERKDVYFDVWTWNVISSIKVLWETNLLNEQKLKFNIDWTVSKIYISEWKSVKTWDILAELDKWELENELKEAQINYENAQINLNKQREKLSGDDKTKELTNLDSQKRKIILSEYDFKKLKDDNNTKINDKIKEIESLKLSLDKLKKDNQISKEKLGTDLKDQKEDLDYKKTTLNDQKWDIEEQISTEKRNLDLKITDYYNAFTDTYNDVQNNVSIFFDNLKSVNDVLEVDSEYKSNLDTNIYFSAKNSIYKNQAVTYYWNFKQSVKILEEKYNTWDKKSLNIDYIIELLNLEKNVYDDIYYLWDFIAKWADNSIEAWDFTSWDISSIKSIWTWLKNSVNSSKTAIDTNINKLKNLDIPSVLKEKSRIAIEKLNKSLQDLEKSILKLQTDYNNLYTLLPEKTKEIDLRLDKEQRTLVQAQKDFEDLKYKNKISEEDKNIEIQNLKQDYKIALKNFLKNYTNIENSEEIKLLQNSLKQAQIAIDQVNKKIENYVLKSPFDWVIDMFNLKIWDNLSTNSQEEKYIHLVNPNIMEIKLKLDQIDIVKVKKWMLAQVTFDSYPDKIFSWSLDSIDSKPIDDNWVKKYQVKMFIDKGNLNIFSWMSANVDIVFEKKENVILVPTMSIETDTETWWNYVTILKDWKKIKQNVEIWLNAEWNTEIISWLVLWDKVLEINFDANTFKAEDFNSPSYWW